MVANQAERILFIVSNAHFYGNSDINASNHFSEIVQAYDVFRRAGYEIDFVSPEGGAIPIGYISTSDPLQKKYLFDNDFMDILETTKKPNEVIPSDYKAVYYGGGGAAMFGVPENGDIQKIVMELYEEHEGIISAICHGTAGIVNLKTQDGTYLVAGKKVNGFPDSFENMDAEYYKTFPFSIQETIVQRGGDFRFSEKGWDGFTVSDGRLISGQDPSAAGLVAEKVIETLKQ
ncbi:MAG: type 1 glutamine amidotransferase domain-containing protein [Maribacter sp.]